MKKIVLASSSPRRKELLKKAGIKFTVVESELEEYFDPKLKPHELVEVLSLKKAKEVFEKHQESIIIAADTIVVCDGKILGKPKYKRSAKKMLKFLCGKTHSVITAFTIIDRNNVITKSEESKITMRNIYEEEISSYLETSEPYDKAGAYAVQGEARKFIEKIEGDFDNAVGLPIKALTQELKKLSAF